MLFNPALCNIWQIVALVPFHSHSYGYTYSSFHTIDDLDYVSISVVYLELLLRSVIIPVAQQPKAWVSVDCTQTTIVGWVSVDCTQTTIVAWVPVECTQTTIVAWVSVYCTQTTIVVWVPVDRTMPRCNESYVVVVGGRGPGTTTKDY